jgi:hypothetical protein
MQKSQEISIVRDIKKFMLLAGIAGFIAAKQGYINAILCGLIGLVCGHALGKGLSGTFLTE